MNNHLSPEVNSSLNYDVIHLLTDTSVPPSLKYSSLKFSELLFWAIEKEPDSKHNLIYNRRPNSTFHTRSVLHRSINLSFSNIKVTTFFDDFVFDETAATLLS